MRFTHPRDYNTVLHLNRELLNDVVDTPVIVYKLNPQQSKTNSYGEASEKRWNVGVQVPCLLKIENQMVSEEVETINVVQKIEAAFLQEELRLKNFIPGIGDIIEFDNIYYEVNTAVDSQYWAGRTTYNHAIICEAHLTKKSNLQLERPKR